MITQKRLKELLNYDPETGLFNWVKRGGKVAGCNKDGYIVIRADKVLYRAHRLAWLYVHGCWPDDQIDHKDRNRSNNSIDNLIQASNKSNGKNQSKCINNTSGVTGVSKHTDYDKWTVRIWVNGKYLHLGWYDSFDVAVSVRKQAEIEHGFSSGHGT